MFYEPNTLCTLCEMLARRQPDLTVCMEQVHNLITFLRLFVLQMPLAYMKLCCLAWQSDAHNGFGCGWQQRWVQVKTHRTIGDAVAHLKGRACRFWQPIFLITLSISAKLLHSPDLYFDGTGENRHHAGTLALADRDIIIPMIGMVQSLMFPLPQPSFFTKPSASGKMRHVPA